MVTVPPASDVPLSSDQRWSDHDRLVTPTAPTSKPVPCATAHAARARPDVVASASGSVTLTVADRPSVVTDDTRTSPISAAAAESTADSSGDADPAPGTVLRLGAVADGGSDPARQVSVGSTVPPSSTASALAGSSHFA